MGTVFAQKLLLNSANVCNFLNPEHLFPEYLYDQSLISNYLAAMAQGFLGKAQH